MQYRRFGEKDLEVSALGFGTMRLPVKNNDPAQIDESATAAMLEYAIENGVNYIDTAYNYHREQSEVVVGRVLGSGLRERVNLATKCPVWLIKTRSDFDVYLAKQLERLKTDHIDMYLLHSLNKDRWPTLVEARVFDFLDEAKADGRIRFAGYSFHDDIGTFRSIADSYHWDFCQIQFNYMDEYFQAGVEGLKYANSKGLAVVIMEPLRGGALVKNVPPEIEAIWKRADVKRTPAEWGLRWVWNHPEVSVVLSGMGAMEQVEENIRTAGTALPNSLTAEELGLYSDVRDSYRSRTKIRCTGCGYCQPCPQGIDIPDWFGSYNNAHMYNSLPNLAGNYDRMKTGLGDPKTCAGCGKCEEACPQNLPVRQLLESIHAELSQKT